MSLVRTLFGGRGDAEARSNLAHPNEWLVELLGGSSTFAGKKVTPATAMSLVPFYSGVTLISAAVAELPLIVYRNLPPDPAFPDYSKRERARNTRQWELLHNQPNEEMAADELWEIITSHLLTWGNACVEKVPDGAGRISELWPIEPERCAFGRVDGQKRVFVDGKPYSEARILHIRALGKTGLVGYSPVQLAKQTLASQLAREEFEGVFWKNGTFIGGFLEHPQELSDRASARLERIWRSRNSGVSKAGKVPVLEEGMKYQPTTMPLKDAQFVEVANLGDHRIAQMLGLIPPHRFGTEDKSLTYQNTETGATEFVRWSLGRWVRRIERSVGRDPEIYPPSLDLEGEFLRDALLRGTTLERYQAYAIGVKHRFLGRIEVRAKEGLTTDVEVEDFDSAPSLVMQPIGADDDGGNRDD